MTNSINPDLCLHCSVRPICSNSQTFTVDNILNIIQNILRRNILTWFLQVVCVWNAIVIGGEG